jgi:hypothetical protein
MTGVHPSVLDLRASLAQQLADASMNIGCVSLDASLASFATPEELKRFRDGLRIARDEVTKAEAAIHDLVFGVEVPKAAA